MKTSRSAYANLSKGSPGEAQSEQPNELLASPGMDRNIFLRPARCIHKSTGCVAVILSFQTVSRS